MMLSASAITITQSLSLVNNNKNFENSVNTMVDDLEKLKIYQKFAAPETETQQLVEDIPLTLNPVFFETQELLKALADLSDVNLIPRDKDYPLYPLLNEIMLTSLRLTSSLLKITVTNRKEKLAALTHLIKESIIIAATPKTHNRPRAVHDSGHEMQNIIDDSWYLLRSSDAAHISQQAYKLRVAGEKLCWFDTTLLYNNYKHEQHHIDDLMIELTAAELDGLKIKKSQLLADYAYYQYAIRVLNKKVSLEDFEYINAQGHLEKLSDLFMQIQRLKGYAKDLQTSGAYPELISILNFSIELTLEIIQTRKSIPEKLDALKTTLSTLTDFSQDFGNAICRTQLIEAANHLRNTVEGTPLNRKEHRLRNGLLGAITLLISKVAITAMIVIAVTQPAVVLNPVFWVIAVASVITLGTASGNAIKWLKNSISPAAPTQQDISRNISRSIFAIDRFYQTNPVSSTFQPLPEAVEEAKLMDSPAEIKKKEAAWWFSYNAYKNYLLKLNEPLSSLNSFNSVTSYEILRGNYREEIPTLLSRLNELKIKTEANSPYHDLLQKLLHNARLLTREFIKNEHDQAYCGSQKQKILALSNTINQTLLFINYPSDTAKDDLMKAATNMRSTVEGSYFFRAENRLTAGILGTITSILALSAMLGSIVIFMPVAPAITPLMWGVIGACFAIDLGALAYGSSMVTKSIWPDSLKQQECSRQIYQEANKFEPTIFRKKPREEPKEEKSVQPSSPPSLALA
jgi:hypothetical protein